MWGGGVGGYESTPEGGTTHGKTQESILTLEKHGCTKESAQGCPLLQEVVAGQKENKKGGKIFGEKELTILYKSPGFRHEAP